MQQVAVCPHCHKPIIVTAYPHDCNEKREAERAAAALTSPATRIVNALGQVSEDEGKE